MRWFTLLSGLISGGCLAAIQIRHFGWWHRSFLNSDVRRELKAPLDSTDKKLALISLIAFLIMLLLISTGHF